MDSNFEIRCDFDHNKSYKAMQYKIKSKKGPGYLKLVYLNGVLKEIKFFLKSSAGFTRWKEAVPFQEQELSGLTENDNIIVQKMDQAKDEELANKIALFCKLYNNRHQESYKVSKSLREHELLKSVPVTEELLTIFFDSEDWRFKLKSIRNYVSRINELQNFSKERKKPKFPDYFSPEYSKSLSKEDRALYREHLQSLGYRPLRDNNGMIINWIRN